MRQRLIFIDLLRGMAIVGVVADHAVGTLHLHEVIPDVIRVPLLLAIRTATPLFFFVFGVMLEFVYVRRATADPLGPWPTVRYLVIRALKVYAAYATVVVAGWTIGWSTLGGALLQLVFLQTSPLSDVLAFYVFAILTLAILLPLRLRLGPVVTFGVALLPWLAIPLIDSLVRIESGASGGHLSALLVGRPDGESYYSLLHGLTVVGPGMVVGRALLAWRRGDGLGHARRVLLGWICFGLAGLILVALGSGWAAFLSSYRGAAGLRTAHLPIYYLSGIVAAAAIILGSSYLPSRIAQAGAVPTLIRRLGARSLLVFVVGNITILLIPSHLVDAGILHRVIAAVLAVAMPIWVVATLESEPRVGLPLQSGLGSRS